MIRLAQTKKVMYRLLAVVGFLMANLASATVNSEKPTINAQTFAIAPQIENNPLTLTQEADQLTSNAFAPNSLLETIAPHLTNCVLESKRQTKTIHSTIHTRYEIVCNGLRLLDSYVTLHHHSGGLSMISASISPGLYDEDTVNGLQLMPLDEMLTMNFDEQEKAELSSLRSYLANVGGNLEPVWSLIKTDSDLAKKSRLIISQRNGQIILNEPTTLHAVTAEVFKLNDYAKEPVTKTLNYLSEHDRLESDYFKVYSPNKESERALSENNHYRYSPTEEPDLFDQVQAYYNAVEALDWFRGKLQYKPEGPAVVIRTLDPVENNASYIPQEGDEPAEIRLGVSEGNPLANLARDRDVIFHEYSHHIIYQFLKARSFESKLLHEGTADYFAYAISGDPNLGESVVPNKPFLRSAALSDKTTFDNPSNSQTAHSQGAYWAAVLWDLRQDIGSSNDQLVYQSLAYLEENATVRDAFLALFNADRDLFPLTKDHPLYSRFGEHQCLIIRRAIARGFSAAISDIDGSTCGFDLAKVAQERSEIIGIEADPRHRGKHPKIFGVRCGAIANANLGKDATTNHGVLLLLGIPIFICLFLIRSKTGEA